MRVVLRDHPCVGVAENLGDEGEGGTCLYEQARSGVPQPVEVHRGDDLGGSAARADPTELLGLPPSVPSALVSRRSSGALPADGASKNCTPSAEHQ